MSGQTPKTNELDERLHGKYYPNAFGACYDAMLDHSRKLESDLSAAVAALKPFAKFHCGDPTCKCYNCIAREIVARMELPTQY